MNPILAFTALSLSALALLASCEVIRRLFGATNEMTRKTAHFGGAAIALVAPLLLPKAGVVLLGLTFAALLLVTKRTALLDSVHKADRVTLGEVFLPLGVSSAALLFLPDRLGHYLFGMLIMGLADGLAGIIGKRWGRHRLVLFGIRKTWEGTLTFFMSTALIVSLVTPLTLGPLALVCLLLTVVEFVSVRGLDNLTLPIAAGILLSAVL